MAAAASTAAALLKRPVGGAPRLSSSSSASASSHRRRLLSIRCQSTSSKSPRRSGAYSTTPATCSRTFSAEAASGTCRSPRAPSSTSSASPSSSRSTTDSSSTGLSTSLLLGPNHLLLSLTLSLLDTSSGKMLSVTGVLAEILKPIMGKGLIPADLDTWKQRRKVITPGFHALFIEAMVRIFIKCSERTTLKLEQLTESQDGERKSAIVDLEAEFSNLALDIIGLGIFNYDFGSITKESPVIKAVYGTLFEAEHQFYIPYWNLSLAKWIVPRQRKFHGDLKVINDCLDNLIKNAKETRQEAVVEKLQQRDYSSLQDVSLLRFLVDMQGADVDDRQLRDDLMTMLIAGHETTAAVLTWSIFLLAQNPTKMRKAQAEVDSVLSNGVITVEGLKGMECVTNLTFCRM